MDNTKIPRLRIFLLTILELTAKGENESCESIEQHLKNGIATHLYKGFAHQFDDNGLNSDLLSEIDEFYKQFSGCTEKNELRKYSCTQNNGLYLLIALAFDKIY